MDKWDRRFIELAQSFSLYSKDPSTKVGCVIIGPNKEICSAGYNGFPRGIEDDEKRLSDRNIKYQIVVHAEMNAALNAARIGVSLLGCTAYITYPPCTRCSTGLIQVGIKRIVWPKIFLPERWKEDIELSKSILKEAGIEFLEFED